VDKGTLSAERNHKGTLVLSISTQGGSPLPVPKLGRGDDELFLKHHNQAVSFQRNEAGNITHIEAGHDILFGSGERAHAPKAEAPSQKKTSASPQKPSGSLQNMSQQRAKHALAAVQGWTHKDASDQKDLSNFVVKMPAMVLMSGFGQTCAFYKSNKKDNHAEVLKVLESWLGHGDIMTFITQSSATEYQIAQAESLEYLNWLKKFAKAYLKGDDDESTAS